MAVYFIRFVQRAADHGNWGEDPGSLLNAHEKIFQLAKLLPGKQTEHAHVDNTED